MSERVACSLHTVDWYVPYARHYNPRFVFFLPHFSLRFIFESGLYCREVSIYMNLFSSKVATKNQIGFISIPVFWWTWNHAKFKGCVNKNRNLTVHRILTFMDHGIALPSDMMPCNALQCPCNALTCFWLLLLWWVLIF